MPIAVGLGGQGGVMLPGEQQGSSNTRQYWQTLPGQYAQILGTTGNRWNLGNIRGFSGLMNQFNKASSTGTMNQINAAGNAVNQWVRNQTWQNMGPVGGLVGSDRVNILKSWQKNVFRSLHSAALTARQQRNNAILTNAATQRSNIRSNIGHYMRLEGLEWQSTAPGGWAIGRPTPPKVNPWSRMGYLPPQPGSPFAPPSSSTSRPSGKPGGLTSNAQNSGQEQVEHSTLNKFVSNEYQGEEERPQPPPPPRPTFTLPDGQVVPLPGVGEQEIPINPRDWGPNNPYMELGPHGPETLDEQRERHRRELEEFFRENPEHPGNDGSYGTPRPEGIPTSPTSAPSSTTNTTAVYAASVHRVQKGTMLSNTAGRAIKVPGNNPTVSQPRSILGPNTSIRMVTPTTKKPPTPTPVVPPPVVPPPPTTIIPPPTTTKPLSTVNPTKVTPTRRHIQLLPPQTIIGGKPMTGHVPPSWSLTSTQYGHGSSGLMTYNVAQSGAV